MTKRLTSEEFVEKAKSTHGCTYDYSRAVYVSSTERVEIGCRDHGYFWQAAGIHATRGAGCPDCAISVRAKNRSHTEDEFIKKARAIHGDKYSYSAVKYSNTRSKIEIFCNTCLTAFWQSPNSHTTYGQGCPACAADFRAQAAVLSREHVVSMAVAVHGQKYDYSSVVYSGALAKVEIVCKEHGSFWQRINAHISGSTGCQSCSHLGGYRRSSPGYFYLISDGCTTKVGITNLTVEQRMKSISKSSGLKFIEQYSTYFADGAIAHDLEKAVLRFLRLTYKQPSEVFDGSTEAFLSVDVPDLLALVAHQITVLTDTTKVLNIEDDLTLPKESEPKHV